MINNNKLDSGKIKKMNNLILEVYKVADYKDKYDLLKQEAENNTVRFEYSRGGETMHRGYYCPSPTFDLVIGNCNRGRLLKRTPKDSKFSYEYAFDKDDNLISVRQADSIIGIRDEEYFIRENGVEYSLMFHEGMLHCISRCLYENGLILRYDFSLCNFYRYLGLPNIEVSKNIAKYCTEITSEIYLYNDGILSKLIMQRYTPSCKIFDSFECEFFRDSEGFISKYKTNSEEYSVSIKRK